MKNSMLFLLFIIIIFSFLSILIITNNNIDDNDNIQTISISKSIETSNHRNISIILKQFFKI